MIQAADTASTNPLLPSWPEFIIGTILFLIVFGVLIAASHPSIANAANLATTFQDPGQVGLVVQQLEEGTGAGLLASADEGAGQHQVREVHTANQQHRANRGEQHQHRATHQRMRRLGQHAQTGSP